MFEIISRFDKTVLYKSETATTAIQAIKETVLHLRGANLQVAYLQGADLQGADLQGANLRGAYLQVAYLQGAYLQGADLQVAYLRGADLQGANLRGAYLRGANLEGADLRGANLQGAYLRGANLQGADLEGAKGLLSKPVTPLQIVGSRHWILVRQDGYLTIGCDHRPLAEWEERYEAIGRVQHYTDAEVQEYRAHIAHCRAWMELHAVVNVIEPTAQTASTSEESK